MERFVFRYQLSEEHLRPAARWMLWHRFGKHFLLRAVIVFALVYLAFDEWAGNGYSTLAVVFTVAGGAGLIGLGLFYPRLMKLMLRSPLLGLDQVVVLDREGLEVECPGLHSKMSWSLMTQVVARHDGLIVQPNHASFWWLPFDKLEGGTRREEIGALLAQLPVQVRG